MHFSNNALARAQHAPPHHVVTTFSCAGATPLLQACNHILESRAQPADQHVTPSLQTNMQEQSPRTLPGRPSLGPGAAGGCCSPLGSPPPPAPAAASLHGTPGCAAGHLAGQQDCHAQGMLLAAACPGLQPVRPLLTSSTSFMYSSQACGPERPSCLTMSHTLPTPAES